MSRSTGKLPNFLIVGGQRCGTTYLWGLLRQHPEIYMPDQKEPQYFQKKLRNPEHPLDQYLKHYTGVRDELAVGDATVENMFFPGIAAMISETLGDVRLIFVLRNPALRAYSHYWMMVMTRREYLSFEKAIQVEERRIQRSFTDLRNYSYLARGRYYEQIQRYLTRFDPARMKFIISRDLYTQPLKVLREVFAFLDVDPTVPVDENIDTHRMQVPDDVNAYRRMNFILMYMRGKPGYWRIAPVLREAQKRMLHPGSKPAMKPETRCWLSDYFKPANRELSRLLNLDIAFWDLL